MSYNGYDLLRDIEEWESKHGKFKMTQEAWNKFKCPGGKREL